MAGTSPAMTFVNTIGFEEVTANFYFFAGAILESAGFGASGLRRLRVGSGLVHALDLGAFAQLGDVVGLRLARHIGLDLALDLVEIGRLAVALFLDLDDVPAELRLHGIGDLARLQRERDGGEFRHHLVLGEEAEVAAVGCAGVLGLLLGEFGEIGALLEFVLDRLGLILGLDQDVAGVDFLLARDLLGGILIDLLHGLVGGRSLAFARQQAVHQEPVARERQPLLEIVVVLDLLVLGGLGDDLHVDQERQDVVLLGRGIHLGEARTEFLLGEGHVALADLRAVNLGEHRIGVVSPGRQTRQQGHGESARQGGRGEAEAQAGFRFRKRSGHGKSL